MSINDLDNSKNLNKLFFSNEEEKKQCIQIGEFGRTLKLFSSSNEKNQSVWTN